MPNAPIQPRRRRPKIETIPPFRLISNLHLLILASAGRDQSEEEAATLSPDGIFPQQQIYDKKNAPLSVVLGLRSHRVTLPKVPAAPRPPEGVCKFVNFSQTQHVQKLMSNILFHITQCLSFSFQNRLRP